MAAEVVLIVDVVLMFDVVLIVDVESVVLDKVEELVTDPPPKRLTTAVYADFFVKSAFQRQAAP